MTVTILKRIYKHLALMALGTALVLPQLAAGAALSISQTPLFITIALPPNITVLLDSSGSMTSAYVPDGLNGRTTLIVYEYNDSASQTTTVTGTTTVISTCTRTSHGSCTRYSYSCPSGYTLNGSSSGSSSTPPSGTTCEQLTTAYSCPTGMTASGSGSSTTCTGYESASVNGEDTVMFKSGAYNPLYYDPSVTYSAPYDSSGNALTTSFTNAYINGYDTSRGSVNLSNAYKATVDYNPASTSQTTDVCNGTFSGGGSSCYANLSSSTGAYYYVYKTSNSGCTGVTTDSRCYTLVTVSSTSGPGSSDERQNFANWYSFYRTRNLTTVSGADRAFNGLNGNMRVAWINLDTCTSLANSNGCTGWSSGSTYDNRIGAFNGTHRTDFFKWVSRLPADTSTPLRTGLQTIGTYYQQSGVDSPYAFTPHVTDSPEYVCRPNYAVVMTDGLWNSDSISSYGNADNPSSTMTLPDGTKYPPVSPSNSHPYSDSSSNSLADIAFYYWSHSLRSDLGTSSSLQYMPYTKNVTVVDNNNNTASLIPYWNPQNDPASWPHMVTFTVGLGLSTTITNPAWGGDTYAGNANGYNNLVTNNISWPSVSSNSSNNVYDLWHAAIDSRGQFFSADSPQSVAQAFNSIVSRIQGRVGSSSAIAVNSTRLDSNTFIYQAQFNSANWTGEVLAFAIGSNGNVGTQAWQASTQIPVAASRSIFTWDETLNSGVGGGANFLWANLNTAEQTALNKNINLVTDGNGSLRLSYLRGDQSNEQSQSGIFRTRGSLLGDIVDSNPFYVGNQNYGFDTSAMSEGSSYDAFLATKTSRTPMLYVGANDGMMHAFNANTGAEVFDYVPRGVYSNLSALTDPLYVHQFYVDGSPASVDAYVGSAWKTLLVTTTGAGAKEVFVMDVTNPLSETAANVLWDYDGVDGTTAGYNEPANTSFTVNSSSPDGDMGYTINEPTIVRMHDGNWYVLFGNGYNSTNQQAVIYLYNLNTKKLYKFSTSVGSISSPNGMSSPNPVDFNSDRITDAIYAGDLLGNLWKLDVSGSSPSSWHFVTYGTSSPTPLFTAADASSNVQPITDRPQVGLNTANQVVVYFGTGTYFQTGDNTVGSNPPVQSFYGIIDDKGSTSADQVLRSTLLQQTILTQTTVNGTNFRITSTNAMTSSNQGWYIDLNYPVAQGERVVSDAVLDQGRVVFTTLIPQGNACQFGGISWLMELDGTSGSRLTVSPFDTNGDGSVNNQDFLTVTYTDSNGNSVTATVPVSGEQSNVGIIKTPGIITSGQLQYKYFSGSTGSIGMITESGDTKSKRISWQQLQ